MELKPLDIPTKTSTYPKKSLRKSFASHILIVEDSPIAANMAKVILADLGCTADIAADGKTALQLIQSKTYDLVFMDIGLPDIDGYTVTESIRANQQSPIAEIPIVALTAHNDSENKQRCLKASMNAVFTKPLTSTRAQHILSTFIPEQSFTKIDARLQETPANIPLSHETVINIDYAKQLLGGNEAVAKDMLAILVDSLPNEIDEMQLAYEKKDWETLRAIVHKLKGSSSYCGTLLLKAACEALDTYIKSDETEHIPALYQKLIAEIWAVQKAMSEKSL